MSNSGHLYQVGGIKGIKIVSGRTYYKVHWSGYSSDQDSWEPEANLSTCKDLLEMFNSEQQRREQRRVTRSSSKAREMAGLSSDDEIMDTTSATSAIKKTPRRRSRHGNVDQSPTTTSSLNSAVTTRQTLTTPTTTPSTRQPTIQLKKAATSPRRPRKTTMDDLTPSRYHLRFSTIKQRPPLHADHSSSDKKTTTLKSREIPSAGVVCQTESTSDGDKKFVSHQQLLMPSKSSGATQNPSWMNLGMAEMLLCLIILALVIASLGYLQYNLKTTTFSNP